MIAHPLKTGKGIATVNSRFDSAASAVLIRCLYFTRPKSKQKRHRSYTICSYELRFIHSISSVYESIPVSRVYSTGNYLMHCGDLIRREGQKGEGICMANPFCCTWKTNTALQSNYSPIKMH